jgi:hypothetical protein
MADPLGIIPTPCIANTRSPNPGSTVREIGFNCFWRCTNLIGVWLEGGSLAKLGESAFDGCCNLCSLGLRAETPLCAIPRKLCWQCGIRWVLIPGSVAAIEDAAFASCASLSEVTFGQPSKLTTIGRFAFSGCRSLQRLHIVASVSAIEDGAFCYCLSLSKVTFGQPSKLTTIGNSAFQDCKSLQRLHIVASVAAIGSSIVLGSGVR